MKIQTGQGTIPLITLVGIWSISALNALPGLAVSPILGKLAVIFPKSTELDIQMLSSLPSLLIIPFIILAGKLNEKVNTIWLLQSGLIIFALSGVLYLLSDKMWQLIAVSALMGIGSGLIVPLSTGLISKFFIGAYRTKQFGLSSAITNVTLVIATIVTGYLAEINWHLPFAVYLLPIVSIVLSFYLKNNMDKVEPATVSEKTTAIPSGQVVIEGKLGVDIKKLIQIMLFYGLATYLVIIISFNLPFLMKEYKFTSGNSGLMISLFFLAIMAPGLMLNQIVGLLRNKTKFYSLLSIAVGMALIVVSRTEWLIGLGCILIGLGYGVIQPIAYDKTTRTAIPKKVTLALAFVMSMNYLAILSCPFIIDFFQSMFDIKSQQFAFIFNGCIALIAAVFAYVKRDSFLFDDKL
ncbi:MFS transporter [Parabacteroides chinchillae]|uniref:Cyanate permease n=1 Tax=Parabacteroides chinchillae TaxID=871327 RepID=A0A8G2BU91_9BACT|nr:MFS transporter [Parabacteroides chinchillae]SEF52711.1 Cyanate permease [Parabacteroides chinchillae]